jgi:hypothetical protein
MNWDQVWVPPPEPSQDNIASVGPCNATDGTRNDELDAAEDGHRAVQTINRYVAYGTNCWFLICLRVFSTLFVVYNAVSNR